MDARQGDYFNILKSLKNGGNRRKVLMFLGSNIGNFSREQSITFFRHLRAVMSSKDLLFIGFDLQKDPHVIVRAYDDSQGVTARFNLNLLTRINRELGADFDLDKCDPLRCLSARAMRRPGRFSLAAKNKRYISMPLTAALTSTSGRRSLWKSRRNIPSP